MQLQETINIIYTHDSKNRKELNSLSGIYKLEVNGVIYVGSAAELYNRIYIHLNSLTGNRHYNTYLQNSYNKYGKDSLNIEILEFTNKDSLISREQYWIDKLQPRFNICPKAGNTLGRVHSEETKKKISKNSRGRKLTDKQKERISLAKLNTELSEENRYRIRKHYNRSSTIKKVLAINIHTKEEILFKSLVECCRELNVYRQNVYKVIKGTYKQTNGYTFIIYDRIKQEETI